MFPSKEGSYLIITRIYSRRICIALAFTTQSSTRGSKVWNKDINRETKIAMAPRRAKIVEAKVAPLWRDREQDGRTFLRRSTGGVLIVLDAHSSPWRFLFYAISVCQK